MNNVLFRAASFTTAVSSPNPSLFIPCGVDLKMPVILAAYRNPTMIHRTYDYE